MLKAFKYRLYPSRAQEHLLEQTLETCRRWYNTCLEERQTAWEERQESIGKYAQLRKVTAISLKFSGLSQIQCVFSTNS